MMVLRPTRRILWTRRRPALRSYTTTSGKEDAEEESKKLLRNLAAKIRLTGPMTIAQYMEEVLLSPRLGYYTKGGRARRTELLGAEGDFVTSPEISQMFGECWGVWAVHEWSRMGRPVPLKLVELGPGTGRLMEDVLRTMAHLAPEAMGDISVHLVEVGEAMRRRQEEQLCGMKKEKAIVHVNKVEHESTTSKFGPPVHWHADLSSVPSGFAFFFAHEFFDALPIHQFVRGDRGCWHEVLVDLDPAAEAPGAHGPRLRLVRSRESTPNAVHLLGREDDEIKVVEVSPKSGLVVRELCCRIVEDGGAALIADYGYDGSGGDTFRAFRRHRPHNPLSDPGMADLTADVDFRYLRRWCQGRDGGKAAVLVYGPVEQREFLDRLGMSVRKEVLLRSCAEKGLEEAAGQIESAYRMLTHPEEMGRRFKFLSVFPATMRPIHRGSPPAGFESTEASER